MSKPNKFVQQMMKWEGAVRRDYNPFLHILESRSPSLNFCFGRSHGLPEGYTLAIFGAPKGGKTVIVNDIIGNLHATDPDAIAVKFDTEIREELQNADLSLDTGDDAGVHNLGLWGIDPNRYVALSVNSPELIFDRIETDVAAKIEDGAKIKLVAIDSINQIQGKRGMNNTSVLDNTIGDLALTLQEGFKRILPIQRRYKFSVIITAHVRAEMDAAKAKYESKVKMGASFGVQHYSEYFLFVECLTNKEGKQDALGNTFEDESKKDMLDKSQKFAQKHRVCMKGNSAHGAATGRVGEFTFDFQRGIINQHEEVYDLACNHGIIGRPNNVAHVFGDKKWNGKPAMLAALRDDSSLQNEMLKQLRAQDMAGRRDTVIGKPADTSDEVAELTANAKVPGLG